MARRLDEPEPRGRDARPVADGGRVVDVSTGLTRIIQPGRIGYAALKGAVEAMTRSVARESGPRRIAVDTVAPRAVQTDFSGGVVRDNPGVNRRISGITALGRACRTTSAR